MVKKHQDWLSVFIDVCDRNHVLSFEDFQPFCSDSWELVQMEKGSDRLIRLLYFGPYRCIVFSEAGERARCYNTQIRFIFYYLHIEVDNRKTFLGGGYNWELNDFIYECLKICRPFKEMWEGENEGSW